MIHQKDSFEFHRDRILKKFSEDQEAMDLIRDISDRGLFALRLAIDNYMLKALATFFLGEEVYWREKTR